MSQGARPLRIQCEGAGVLMTVNEKHRFPLRHPGHVRPPARSTQTPQNVREPFLLLCSSCVDGELQRTSEKRSVDTFRSSCRKTAMVMKQYHWSGECPVTEGSLVDCWTFATGCCAFKKNCLQLFRLHLQGNFFNSRRC